jgi:hypothetical protein
MLVASTLPLADKLAVATGEKLTCKMVFVPGTGLTGGHEAMSELKVGPRSVPVTIPPYDVKMG